jgi:hypothetical protein
MKTLASILAMFLLGLSLIPCSDTAVSASLLNTNTFQFYGATPDHDHSGDADDANHVDFCSPFCGCSCCGLHIVSTDEIVHIDMIFYHLAFDQGSFGYTSPIYFGFLKNVWQPPQLV